MLKTSMQRYGCWLPYITAFVQGTQISRSLRCLNSKALEDIFRARWNSDLSAALRYWPTLPSWLVLADKLPLASGARWDKVWQWNTSEHSLTSIWKLSHSLVPWQSRLGKAAFLLRKYFNSFKYCDNWSALGVTTQVQEPGLASIMNTMWLPSSFCTKVKSGPFQQEQKQYNENRKMGSWYIKLF